MFSMTMQSDYSRVIAHGVDEDTDDLEPMDPSIFFGADEDDDLEEEIEDIDEDDDDEIPEIEEDEEY